MKIINLKQGSQEWLDWRRSGVGASDVPAILGYCEFKGIRDVYDEKVYDALFPVNSYMRRGSHYESEARAVFEHEIGQSYPSVCVEHSTKTYFKASLDGFNDEYKEVLEIKIPSSAKFESIQRGSIPEVYKIQMYWQMYVAGAKKGYLMVYHPETKESVINLVEYDEAFIEAHLPKIEAFWQSVQKKEPPVNTNAKYEEVEDKELHYLLSDYMDLKKEIALFEEKLKQKRDVIIKKCGNKSVQCGNFRVQKKEISRVDYKIACTDHNIDLSPYQKSATLTWTILEKKEKENGN